MSRPRSVGGDVLALALIVLVFVVGLVSCQEPIPSPPPALPPVPTLMRAPAPSFQPLAAGVSPIAECWYGKNWRWLVVWSYSSDVSKTLAEGAPDNIVTVNADNAQAGQFPAQPTSFQSGFVRYAFVTKVPYFTRPVDGAKVEYVQWKLDGKATKLYLDERAYQCFPARFAMRIRNAGAGTLSALQAEIAQRVSVNVNRVNVTARTASADTTEYTIEFKRDPTFDYVTDFVTQPKITDSSKYPDETEPLDPLELLVQFSQLANADNTLLSTIASSAGGTYEQSFSSPNVQLRTQSVGLEIVTPLYPKDPTTPQGIVGNSPPGSTGGPSGGPPGGPSGGGDSSAAGVVALSGALLVAACLVSAALLQ